MKSIVFKNVNKSFGDVEVIKDLNLEINEGERLILLGPSGCGKSTILRMISGLEDLSSGEIYLNGSLANNIESGDRSIAMVFQNYALYPHMSVYDNVDYGLKMNKIDLKTRKEKVANALNILDLVGLEERFPRELSGGQRQRVALSRALVKESDFFLLDEPLSNLDAQLRGHARKELVKIHEMYKQTFIYVTHDQIEAMTIGDRIALLDKGKIQMLDTPSNVYHKPANVFVARFIGSPAMNITPVSFDSGVIEIGDQRFTLSKPWKDYLESLNESEYYLGVRPERIKLSNEKTTISIPVHIDYIEDYGNRVGYYYMIGDNELIATMEIHNFDPQKEVYWNIDEKDLHFFNKSSENNIGYPKEVRK